MRNKSTYRSVLAALTIILLGLFMLCSQKQMVETPGEDMSGGDDAFRDELLAMLGMEDDEAPADSTDPEAGFEETATSSEENDLMALLAGLDDDDNGNDFFEETEATAQPAPASQTVYQEPVAESSFSGSGALLSEVRRLEDILERRSSQVDSLRRIIDNRSARIAELQTEVAKRRSGVPMPTVQPQLAARSKPSSHQPLAGLDGPFVQKYNAARQKFESYDYQGCIDAMAELLATESSHILADNAQYWIGESYYGLKQYQKAIIEFQKVYAYEATDKYDDAQLMIGLSYVRLSQPQLARTTFGEFLNTYAGSEYARIAKRYYENI